MLIGFLINGRAYIWSVCSQSGPRPVIRSPSRLDSNISYSNYIRSSLQDMHFIENSIVTVGSSKCNARQALTQELGSFHVMYDRWGRAITVLIYSLGKCDPRDLPFMNSQSRIVSPFLHVLNQMVSRKYSIYTRWSRNRYL